MGKIFKGGTEDFSSLLNCRKLGEMQRLGSHLE